MSPVGLRFLTSGRHQVRFTALYQSKFIFQNLDRRRGPSLERTQRRWIRCRGTRLLAGRTPPALQAALPPAIITMALTTRAQVASAVQAAAAAKVPATAVGAAATVLENDFVIQP